MDEISLIELKNRYESCIETIDKDEQLVFKRVVFNGIFFKGFDTDSFLLEVECRGMKVTWGITNATDFYVVNFDHAHYSKLKSALRKKEMGASFKILSFDYFCNIINSLREKKYLVNADPCSNNDNRKDDWLYTYLFGDIGNKDNSGKDSVNPQSKPFETCGNGNYKESNPSDKNDPQTDINHNKEENEQIETTSRLLKNRFGIIPDDSFNVSIFRLRLSDKAFAIIKQTTKLRTVSDLMNITSTELTELLQHDERIIKELVACMELIASSSLKSVICFDGYKDSLVNYKMILSDTYLQRVPIGDIYGLEPAAFEEDRIGEKGFSVRTNNCLERINPPTNTVADLLKLSYQDLNNIRGFGAKCFGEIDACINTIIQEVSSDKKTEKEILASEEYRERKQFLEKYKENILKGEVDIIDANLRLEDIAYFTLYREAIQCLDPAIMRKAIESPKELKHLMEFLNAEAVKEKTRKKRSDQLWELYFKLPIERRSNNIEGFVQAHTRELITAEKRINYLRQNNIRTFRDFIMSAPNDSEIYLWAMNLLKWSAFDLKQDIIELNESLCRTERDEYILNQRAKGFTLDQIGKELDLTRERVRQIEKKIKANFNTKVQNTRIILKIYAVRNQDEVLTPGELSEYFGELTEKFLYLLRSSENPSFVYDKELDVFVVGNLDLGERTQNYIETLPDTFNEEDKAKLLKRGIEEYDIGEEIFETALKNEYKKTGSVYHRSALKLSGMYDVILREFYPEGLYVYGDEEIELFRGRVKEKFGDVSLPVNNRALTARICDVGILCGRGTYKAKSKEYLSKNLKDSIFDFINQNKQGVVLINTLFSTFEEQLREEGIDNRYYLQGILREYFGDKLFFRRDYVAKDKITSSIHEQIVSFIHKSDYPVKKQELQEKFPGVTDIIFQMATSDPDIINLFGRYIHASRLKITESDKRYLRGCINRCIAENNPAHCKTIFEYIENDNPALLINNYIDFAFSMYSLLEYYFRADYEFSRPFVATKGTVIDTVKNIMKETVASSDEISIDEIRSFAGEHHINIYSMLDFLNSCNETHLIADSNQVVCVEMTGLNKEISDSVEKLIYDSLDEQNTIPIAHLECISRFPKIEVPWTAWLIYSTMKKWGTTVDVGVSSNFMRSAVPLISRHGEMNIEQYKEMNVDSVGDVFVPDNLENIDELAATFSDEEWEEFLI